MAASSPRVYLLHIRDCCEKLIECGSLRDQETIPPHLLLDAVCRNLEIIGEASRKLAPDFRATCPQIPWRQMTDLRNVLIHNYEGADPEMVWTSDYFFLALAALAAASWDSYWAM